MQDLSSLSGGQTCAPPPTMEESELPDCQGSPVLLLNYEYHVRQIF